MAMQDNNTIAVFSNLNSALNALEDTQGNLSLAASDVRSASNTNNDTVGGTTGAITANDSRSQNGGGTIATTDVSITSGSSSLSLTLHINLILLKSVSAIQ